MVIPCAFKEVKRRWQSQGVLENLREGHQGLRPEHLERGFDGLREDLEVLGLFSRQWGDLINMPDVYRVGFGLGRKGGVKPIR